MPPAICGTVSGGREEQRGQGRGWQSADLHSAPDELPAAAQLPLPPAARKRHQGEENAGSMSRPRMEFMLMRSSA
uniref:Uncharacterized protein n=1 Tax=Agrobacterium tomkonis TaxID=1183410 RepID=A0A2Z2PXX8_9HYPH|nr:hypothetical protein [Agrobacterium tomkonis]